MWHSLKRVPVLLASSMFARRLASQLVLPQTPCAADKALKKWEAIRHNVVAKT
jgi:hypothetical protein